MSKPVLIAALGAVLLILLFTRVLDIHRVRAQTNLLYAVPTPQQLRQIQF